MALDGSSNGQPQGRGQAMAVKMAINRLAAASREEDPPAPADIQADIINGNDESDLRVGCAMTIQ
jgi:hypothetical protein